MPTNSERRTTKKLPFLVAPKKVVKTIGSPDTWQLELISKGGLTPNEVLRIEELAPGSDNKQKELADKIAKGVADHNLALQHKIIKTKSKINELKRLPELTAEQSTELMVLEANLKADQQNFVTPGEVYFQVTMSSLRTEAASATKDPNVFNSISDPNAPSNKMFIKIYNILPEFFIPKSEEIERDKKESDQRTYAHIAVILSTRLVQSQGEWTIEDVKEIEEQNPDIIKQLIRFVSAEIGQDSVDAIASKLRGLKASEFSKIEAELNQVIDGVKREETVDVEAEVVELDAMLKSTDGTAIAA